MQDKPNIKTHLPQGFKVVEQMNTGFPRLGRGGNLIISSDEKKGGL